VSELYAVVVTGKQRIAEDAVFRIDESTRRRLLARRGEPRVGGAYDSYRTAVELAVLVSPARWTDHVDEATHFESAAFV
jgi:hypothetical protein